LRRRSEKCVTKGSKYAHLKGLYLSFHLNWVLGPFVQGRLQNLKASEDTFGHDIIPLTKGPVGKSLLESQVVLAMAHNSNSC